jgi:signal transduction histidine kinase
MTPAMTTIEAPQRVRLPRSARRRVAAVSEPAEHAWAVGEERLAAYIAHELRTPLALQRALLELALADPCADARCWREVAEDVLDACMQQERLLEACLTLARSRCGLALREVVDIAAIIAQVLRDHDLSSLETDVSLEPASVAGDPALVERLAANLVSNAIRHNFPGGWIQVATHTCAGHVSLIVANSGPIIPAAELGRLFQPFQRLGSHARPPGEGIGLGLPIVLAIAGAHDACVTAEVLIRGGLRIAVRFPALLPAPARRKAPIG